MYTEAIIIGMPYDLFWFGDTHLFFNYLDAYKRTQQEQADAEMQKINVSAWLQGVYTLKAIAGCFGKSKYPEKPVTLGKKDDNHETDGMTMEEKQMLAAMNGFRQLTEQINKNMSKKKEEGK